MQLYKILNGIEKVILIIGIEVQVRRISKFFKSALDKQVSEMVRSKEHHSLSSA